MPKRGLRTSPGEGWENALETKSRCSYVPELVGNRLSKYTLYSPAPCVDRFGVQKVVRRHSRFKPGNGRLHQCWE